MKLPELQSWKQGMDAVYLSFLGVSVGKAFSCRITPQTPTVTFPEETTPMDQ